MREDLEDLRRHIDSIDAEIIGLMVKRLAVAGKIGKVKKELGMGILQPGRESEILNKRRELAAAAGLEPGFVETLFKSIMAESKRIQK